MWLSTVFHSPVSRGMEFPWQAVSRLATRERRRWKIDRFHHADTTADPFLHEGHVQRGVLDFSLCFQHWCLFFVFFVFCFCFSFSLFISSFSFFSISLSVACLPASFLLAHTWHLARSTAHPKLYSSLFSSPLNLQNDRNCRENAPNFSKLSVDRPWSWSRRS